MWAVMAGTTLCYASFIIILRMGLKIVLMSIKSVPEVWTLLIEVYSHYYIESAYVTDYQVRIFTLKNNIIHLIWDFLCLSMR